MKETPLLDEKLLEMLVCPGSGKRLQVNDDELVSVDLSASYPIENGVPLIYDRDSNLPPV
ncbi:MAG: hypothetical protein LBJ96_00405 [Holosporaceae bacterium]|jgi:uncharacterized protein YbaR (Trm112 family)|nr:hypothetical protein [Holosporaceae bacterium]